MKFFAFIIIVPLVLIAALVAAAYVADRFHIGTKQNQQIIFIPTPQDWDFYGGYLRAIIRCVGNNYSSCGLCRPGDLPQHVAPDGQGIICENRKIFFTYFFDRRCSMNGGIGNFSYDSTPIEQIVRKLNSTLPNYCVALGLAPAYIVDARDASNGRISLTISI